MLSALFYVLSCIYVSTNKIFETKIKFHMTLYFWAKFKKLVTQI